MFLRQIILFVALVGLLCAMPAVSSAASVCPARPNSEQEARDLASTWFNLGEQLVKHAAFEEAVAAFECSLSMVVHPATLYNAGQAALLASDKLKALSFFEQYLEHNKLYDDWNETVEQQARALREELEKSGELGTTPGIEDPENPDGMGELPMDAAVSSQGDTLPGHSSEGLGQRLNRPVAIGSFAAAGATAVLGLAFNIAAARRQAQGGEANSYAQYRDIENDFRTYRGWAIAGYAISAAALASGIFFYWRHRKDQAGSPTVMLLDRGFALSVEF